MHCRPADCNPGLDSGLDSNREYNMIATMTTVYWIEFVWLGRYHTADESYNYIGSL